MRHVNRQTTDNCCSKCKVAEIWKYNFLPILNLPCPLKERHLCAPTLTLAKAIHPSLSQSCRLWILDAICLSRRLLARWAVNSFMNTPWFFEAFLWAAPIPLLLFDSKILIFVHLPVLKYELLVTIAHSDLIQNTRTDAQVKDRWWSSVQSTSKLN